MNDENATIGGGQQRAAGTDSHAPARKPRRKAALLDGANQSAGQAQNGLDVPVEVPLHLRPVLNGYAEVAALGIAPERTLRRLVATGRVKRSVIRLGRHLRFVRDVLIAELTAVKE